MGPTPKIVGGNGVKRWEHDGVTYAGGGVKIQDILDAKKRQRPVCGVPKNDILTSTRAHSGAAHAQHFQSGLMSSHG